MGLELNIKSGFWRFSCFASICCVLLVFFITGCSGPEEKKMKFYNKGKVLYEKGEFIKARLELKNAAQIDPKFTDAYMLLGEVNLKLNDLKKAYQSFNKAVDLDPGLIKAQIQLGRILLTAGGKSKAREKIQLVLKADPENQEALFLKGSLLYSEKKSDKAKSIFENLIKNGMTDPNLFILLSEVYAGKSDFENSENILKKGLKKNPDSVLLYSAAAKFYNYRKKRRGAIDALKKAIELDPDDINFKLRLADSYWQENLKKDAGKILRLIIRKEPENGKGYLIAAGFYLGKNDPADAESLMKTGISKNAESVDLYIRLAELYTDQKRITDGIELLKKILKLKENPSDPGALRLKTAIARIYFQIGDYETAERYISEILNESPMDIDALFLKGNLCIKNNDGLGAVSIFRTISAEKPDRPLPYLRLAEAHSLSKEYGLAVDVLNKALQIAPKDKSIYLLLARIQARKKDYSSAEATLREAIKNDPKDPDLISALGDLYIFAGRNMDAEKVYKGITSKFHENPIGYIKLSLLYDIQKQREKKTRVLEKGYAECPESIKIINSLIQNYIDHMQLEKASAVCREQIARKPRNAMVYDLLGRVFVAGKNYKDAEISFNKAIELKPKWDLPWNDKAKLALITGRGKEAIQNLENKLKADPENIYGSLALGMLYQETKEYKKAIDLYKKIYELRPDLWNAANNLAFLLGESSKSREDLKKALVIAERALRMQSDSPMIFDTIGWIYFKMKDYAKSHEFIAKALSQFPGSGILNYHMGMVLFKQGRFDEAKINLKKATNKSGKYQGKAKALAIYKQITAKQ